MKRLILLAAFAAMTAASVNAQVIVNSDGTHSVVHGSVIVNSDGSHSVVHGSTIANSNGSHSTIHGSTIVNSDGTHSTILGRTIVNSDGSHSTIHGRRRSIIKFDGTHTTIHGRSGIIINSDGTHFSAIGKLPMKAEEFIGRHFANDTISVATVNRMFLRTTYDVVFTDGRFVEFDRRGRWKAVNDVPEEIVPDDIRRHIAANYPGNRVSDIRRGRRKWSVRLDDGLELNFNRNKSSLKY